MKKEKVRQTKPQGAERKRKDKGKNERSRKMHEKETYRGGGKRRIE